MSSETSTKPAGLKPDASAAGLQPWQFFVLAALGCATAVTFLSRDQGPTAVILLGVLMAAAALVGNAALRALRPLVSLEEDRTVMVGQRTRVALEREKLMTLRSIKELEFDRAMGRLSDEDWNEMSGRLRARAARLIRQLDAGAGYRGQIERDLAKRIEGAPNARLKGSRSEKSATPDKNVQRLQADDPSATEDGRNETSANADVPKSMSATADVPNEMSANADDPSEMSANADGRSGRSASLSGERLCSDCSTANDADAKFCKGCGQRLQ